MEKKKSWKIITEKGKYIMKNWLKIAKKNELKIKVSGLPALCSFYFESKNNNAYKNLYNSRNAKAWFFSH